MQSEAKSKALEQFTDYFVKNYPGPDTVIADPKWHAPKIFAAAYSAITAAKAAAQADYEQRIRSALVDVPVEPVASTSSDKLALGDMPSYGDCSANDMLSAVADAIFGDRDISLLRQIDNERSVGHQMVPTINFNSLNRIISAFHNHRPSLHREGEDNAEVIDKARTLATAILQNFGAMEDGNGEEAPELSMARDLLAATRSGSATSAKGCAE